MAVAGQRVEGLGGAASGPSGGGPVAGAPAGSGGTPGRSAARPQAGTAAGRGAGTPASVFAKRWTAVAVALTLLVVVLALVLHGGRPALYWQGEPLANAPQVISRAERAMEAVAKADEGVVSGRSRCYFLLANAATHDVESELRCGPVLLPWSRASAPWLAYRLSAVPARRGSVAGEERLSVALSPAPSSTVALFGSQVLRQPDGSAGPTGAAKLSPPVVPRQRAGWGGVLVAPPDGLAAAPVGDVIGDWGATYRLVAYGKEAWLDARLDRGALRKAFNPRSSPYATTRAAIERGLPPAKLLLAPKGDVFAVAELAVSPGEAAGAVPAQANGTAGASSDRPELEVLGARRAIILPSSATGSASGSLTVAAAVPAHAKAELVVSDKGLSQQVSLATGALSPGPAVLTRVSAAEQLSAQATLGKVGVRLLDASLVWFAGSDGGTVPPSYDLAYLQVLAATKPPFASLPVSDFTLVMPGGEVVGAQALPDSDRQVLAVGFLVPASFSDGTVVVATGRASLSAPVHLP